MQPKPSRPNVVQSDPRPRVGFLTFDLQEFTADCLSRINAASGFRIKAYPVYDTVAEDFVDFDYSRTGRSRGRFRFAPQKGTPECLPIGINMRAAWNCVRENDIIVLYGLHAGTALMTSVLARVLKKPVISVNRTLPVKQEAKRSWLVRSLKRVLLKCCHLHIAHTPNALTTLPKVYGIDRDLIREVPFEAGLRLFKEKLSHLEEGQPRDIQRRELGWRQNECVFLFVGTLLRLKGISDLLKAAALVRRRHANIRVVLCGREVSKAGELCIKEYQNECCRLGIDDIVTFAGKKPLDDLVKYYAAADVFVLPTHRDTWPKVLAEASCFNLPLITTTSCGSAQHIVRHGKTGLLVKRGDTEELANAMTAVLDERTRYELGTNAHLAWETYCDPDKETIGFLSAIESLRRATIRTATCVTDKAA